MTYATLEEQIRRLPEDCIDEVASFVEYLIYRQDANTQTTPAKPSIIGAMKGHIHYIADDFDETPECFKEYIAQAMVEEHTTSADTPGRHATSA